MKDFISYEEILPKRLSQLRLNKKVSARDMSLSIGQGETYINHIESGSNLPSMAAFFYICEYLEITPKDFFDFDNNAPKEADELINTIKKMDKDKISFLKDLLKRLK